MPHPIERLGGLLRIPMPIDLPALIGRAALGCLIGRAARAGALAGAIGRAAERPPPMPIPPRLGAGAAGRLGAAERPPIPIPPDERPPPIPPEERPPPIPPDERPPDEPPLLLPRI